MGVSLVAIRRRERKFIAAMARGMNQSEAAVAAGYRGKNAKDAGWRIASRPRVKAKLAKLGDDALARAGVTTTQIVRELARVAMLDPRNILDEFGNVRDFSDLDSDTAAAIAGMDVEELFDGSGQERKQTGMVRKVKFWNKVEALKELSRIARLAQDAPAIAAPTGPGLQVIVQQVAGSGPAQTAQRVEVNLPGPGLRYEESQSGT